MRWESVWGVRMEQPSTGMTGMAAAEATSTALEWREDELAPRRRATVLESSLMQALTILLLIFASYLVPP